MSSKISADYPYQSHYTKVYSANMHYIEQGRGDPILFLHSIPTSSYVWRNIIPHLSSLGRCIAVDLIGMGKSDKPDIEYSITDHIKYIDQFITNLGLKNITLVMHGWGSVIGLNWAMNHEDKCKGLAFYEAYLRPFNGDAIPLPLGEEAREMSDQKNIDDLIMHGTYYIDKVLPQEMMRPLTEIEKNHYREPFKATGAGKALRQYLRELPRGDQNTSVDQLIANYSHKLKKSQLPKLMLYSIPGFVTTISTAMWAKENLPNLELVDIGEELHYAQESNPALMGEAISVWLQGIEQNAKIESLK